MSDFAVVLAPSAENDIAGAFRWYQERNKLAANGFRAEVLGVIDLLADTPLSRPADDMGTRKRVLRRFPVLRVLRGERKYRDGSGGRSPSTPAELLASGSTLTCQP